MTWGGSVVTAVGLAFVGHCVSAGQPAAQARLTDTDRVEIQELSAKYAKTLGSCAAEEYADLFAPETGYFASNFRGEVVGRERLMALVRSERHCTAAAPASGNAATPNPGAANNAPRPVPTLVIEMSSTGPVGRAELGEKVGRYDDEYVKTATGWRFKSRTVITAPEIAAGLTVQDIRAIRRLAGTDLGQFDDVYAAGPDGVKRFRSSGVAMGLSQDGVTGRAYLKNNGGHYQDVYVRTPQGGWRFKSRMHVTDAQ